MRAPETADVALQREKLRAELNILADEFVVGCGAQFFLEDRALLNLQSFLDAQRVFRGRGAALARLVWIANSAATAEKARTLVEKLNEHELLTDRIQIIHEESDLKRLDLLSVCDVFLAIRFNALQGIPLLALAAMARGIPTLVGFFGPSAELPIGAVIPVPMGQGEQAFVAKTIAELRANAELRARIAAGAREYVELVCDPLLVLQDLESIFAAHGTALHERLLARRKLIGSLTDTLTEDFLARSDAQKIADVDLDGASPSVSVFEKACRDLGWRAG